MLNLVALANGYNSCERLSTHHDDVIVSSDTTAENVVELMKQFAKSSNPRLSNLATIFLEVRAAERSVYKIASFPGGV